MLHLAGNKEYLEVLRMKNVTSNVHGHKKKKTLADGSVASIKLSSELSYISNRSQILSAS